MYKETLNIQENELKKDLKKLKEEIEYIDPTPEMSTNEIMSLSNEDIINLVSEVERNREDYFNHKDINGLYAIINGKKVYLCDDSHLPNHNGTYLRYEFNRTGYFSLFTKKGDKYKGIYYNDGDRYDNKEIYKGKLTFNNDGDFGIRLNGK